MLLANVDTAAKFNHRLRHMPQTRGITFHHVGVACESIADEAGDWGMLGYEPEDARFSDPAQGIAGQFMTGGGPRIELLEPAGGSSTLASWLKRRVKLYHFGYVADDFDFALESFKERGAMTAREPTHSVYFGTRIVFLMMPNLMLIELIEAAR